MIAVVEANKKPVGSLLQSREFAAAEMEKLRAPLSLFGRPVTPVAIFAANGVVIGTWLLFLAAVVMIFPSLPRGLFYPFAERFRPRWGLVPLLLGTALLVFGTVAFLA